MTNFNTDPHTREEENKEYTPHLPEYDYNFHDHSEGSEVLDESLRMTEQPYSGNDNNGE